MLPRRPKPELFSLFALWLLCALQLSLAQNLTCPAQQTTFNQNGTLEDRQVPTSSPIPPPRVPTSGIEGWFNIAGLFADAVRPGTLPYEVIEQSLTSAGIPCSVIPTGANCTQGAPSSGFDVGRLLRDFATWWTGILVVVCIGAVVAILFPIVGCIFCCCRCCGNCGGKRRMKRSKYTDCKMVIFTITLLLFTLLLVVAVVLSFFSNEQSYRSLENFQTSLNNVAAIASDYAGNTLDQVEALFCRFLGNGGLVTVVLQEVFGLGNVTSDLIEDIQGEATDILTTLNGLTNGIGETADILSNISATTVTLIEQGADLQNTVQELAENVTSLATQCNTAAAIISALVPICAQIPPSEVFSIGANFSMLPNISPQVEAVNNSLQMTNLQAEIAEGQQRFDSTVQNIQTQVNSNLDSNSGALGQIMQINDSIFATVGSVAATARGFVSNDQDIDACPSYGEIFSGLNVNTLSVGFIRQCVFNQGINFIRQYDVYRYAVGIVFCSLSLVTIVLVSIGILCGVIGFRRDKKPYERTFASHCGGIFLLVAVGFTFVFGLLLLVLATIGFFFGANAQKVCQSLEAPDYPAFTNIVDNTDLWGGSLLGVLIFQRTGLSNNPSAALFLSEALRSCQQNEALYTAFNLSNLLPSGSIQREVENRVNFTEVTGQLRSRLNDVQTAIAFQSDGFLSNESQDALRQFTNANVSAINITAFRQQTEAPLVQFDIGETIQNLTNIRDQLSMNGATSVAQQTQYIIDGLTDLQNNQIPGIRAQVDSLEARVSDLQRSIGDEVASIVRAVDRVNQLVQNITGETLPNFINQTVVGALNRVVNNITNYIGVLNTSLSSEVARCQPIFFAYTELYNSVCEVALDGLNGFWWSLGFCSLLFIPIIIFAVITSVFYLRSKHSEADDFPYEDSFPPHPEALCKNTSFSKHSQLLKDKLEAESINTSSVVTALEVSNGFWWSLGFCSLLFIPIIIFAVITSAFYLKMKYYFQETDDGYVEYTDHQTELKSY